MKTKTYIIMLSVVFPANHSKAGMPTGFKDRVLRAVCKTGERFLSDARPKMHTIRANYQLWKKRIDEVERGNAVLSIRQWTGKPYRSYTIEIARLTKDDGVGIQKLQFDKDRDGIASLKFYNVDGYFPDAQLLANNDGLSVEDWREWFRGYDLSKPMAIIHFTNFRYK
ncbi:MAG: hypothetical protein J5733_12190 [Bacteroidaceae bacterium]|nr:hypothetical protein [Bacteroidaceae bacterium]